MVGWFGSDQAGSCVLTQSSNPSQVESGWVGWLLGWLAGWLVGWLAGWLVGWFGMPFWPTFPKRTSLLGFWQPQRVDSTGLIVDSWWNDTLGKRGPATLWGTRCG